MKSNLRKTGYPAGTQSANISEISNRGINNNPVNLNSNRLVKNTVTPGQIVPLYDSVYVPPERNPAVLQDTDPSRSITYKDAMRRYEEEVERKKRINEQVIN